MRRRLYLLLATPMLLAGCAPGTGGLEAAVVPAKLVVGAEQAGKVVVSGAPGSVLGDDVDFVKPGDQLNVQPYERIVAPTSIQLRDAGSDADLTLR